MELLLLTADPEPGSVLPALTLLPHGVRTAAPEVAALLDAGPHDAVLVDARTDLAAARGLCRLLGTTGMDVPVVAVRHRGRPGRGRPWSGGSTRSCCPSTGPAEIDARLRLLVGRRGADAGQRERRQDQPRRARHRRGHLHRAAARPAARPHLQGVRAAQVPRPARGPGVHPRPAAAGGLGLRLLRRHPHRRRARPPAARQARHRARVADRHRAQRRLQDRAAEPGRVGRGDGPRGARRGRRRRAAPHRRPGWPVWGTRVRSWWSCGGAGP